MSYLVVPKALGKLTDSVGSIVDLRRLLDMVMPIIQKLNGGIYFNTDFRPSAGLYTIDHDDVAWADGVWEQGHKHDGVTSAILDPGRIKNPTDSEKRQFGDYGIVRGPRVSVQNESTILLHYMAHGQTSGPSVSSTGFLSVVIQLPVDFSQWLRGGTNHTVLMRPMIFTSWEFPTELKGGFSTPYFSVITDYDNISGGASDFDYDVGDSLTIHFRGSSGGPFPTAAMAREAVCHWILSALVEKKL